MSATIAELRDLTDEQIIALHDEAAINTSVGTDYWMREMERRAYNRSASATQHLARVTLTLSIVAAVTGVLALVVAVITLLRP